MSSFHDQWMCGWQELRDVMPVLAPYEFNRLRADLSLARELIDEDNDARDRRQGGGLIRVVRQECRRVREGQRDAA